LALTLIAEGNSIRSAQRISGIDKKTILRLLINAGEKCETLMSKMVRNVPVTDVQADEICGFVGKKQGNKGHGNSPYNAGIERNTKMVLAFELGNAP
jgi:hypothetical protein